MAGRGSAGWPSAAWSPPPITSIRTSVPSFEANVTWRVRTSGTSTAPGAWAQRETSPLRAS